MSAPAHPEGLPPTALNAPLSDDDFEQLESILDDLKSRHASVPTTWEYCDGFLTALLCCRRLIQPSEYFPVLFSGGDPAQRSASGLGDVEFRDEAQFETFIQLWMRRWNQVAQALQQPIETLTDDGGLEPYVIDLRSIVAGLPEERRAEALATLDDTTLPAFAQMWALGFMDAVEAWPEDWRTPRDRELGPIWEDALRAIADLLDDDTAPPEINPIDDNGPPSMSLDRLQRFHEAVLACYDLHDVARELGPPVATVRKAPEPGRNDPCPCGSGKKYKKCCGAA
ncbi:UPF0149 family protein [Tepidimonas charontis]|uniref:YecA family protein n=1 Tax=Tepidimonas charontis TaxID=2267262 RepID=A0A554XHE7_9BURK|nr:UPF0149 family protein [Tepidimonas charontis]TSE35261.1 yecA family protein [Tepidimonas charontis]